MSLPSPFSDRLGEFELIARLTESLRIPHDVVRGVGDDAAIVDWQPGLQLVVTCDAQVEGTHFLRAFASPEQIGRKALSVNLSDIAAMGARPRFALVSLILQPPVETSWLELMYAGLRAQAEAFGVSIIGGNVASTSGPTCIDITLIGDVAAGRALRRDGGRPGDRVYVSGYLGAAVAGLATLRTDASSAPHASLAEARAAYRDPLPQVALGEALAESGAVTAMIDISDGFSSDLHHLCDESRVGALIDEHALPISAATRQIAGMLGASPLAWALDGGDDYQLLFAVSADREAALAALPPELSGRAHAVGWLTSPELGVRLRHPNGATDDLPPRGWDHLTGSQS